MDTLHTVVMVVYYSIPNTRVARHCHLVTLMPISTAHCQNIYYVMIEDSYCVCVGLYVILDQLIRDEVEDTPTKYLPLLFSTFQSAAISVNNDSHQKFLKIPNKNCPNLAAVEDFE